MSYEIVKFLGMIFLEISFLLLFLPIHFGSKVLLLLDEKVDTLESLLKVIK